MPWALIFGLLGSLPGTIGDYFKGKNELALAKMQAEIAIEQAKVTQAQAYATADLQKANALLGVTSNNFKQLTFFLWYIPFGLAIICPSYAKIVFDNLHVLPVWYTQTAITLLLSVWGINVASGVIANIFTNVTAFLDKRKKENLPEDMFYSVLRSVKGNITQAEVDVYNKALEEINKQK